MCLDTVLPLEHLGLQLYIPWEQEEEQIFNTLKTEETKITEFVLYILCSN